MSKSKCINYVFADGICVLRGDVKKYGFASCPHSADVAVVRAKEANSVSLKQGDKYVPYVITIPDKIKTQEDFFDSIECYQQAIKKAKEKGFREIVIEAFYTDNNDILETAFYLIGAIKEGMGLSIGVKPMKIYILCPTWDVYVAYMRVTGRNVGSVFSISRELKTNEAILVPTEKSLRKFEYHYKVLKRYEPTSTFFRGYRQPKFKLGEYYLTPGKKEVSCYYFAPLVFEKKDGVEEYKNSTLESIEKIMDSMTNMGYTSITIPALEYIPQRKLFKKDTSQSDEFIKQMIELVVDRAEEYNLQVEFYCISDDLTEFVRDVLNEVVLKHNNIAVLQEEKCNNVNNVDNITSNQNTESENGDEDLC